MGFRPTNEVFMVHDILGELRILANEHDSIFRKFLCNGVEGKLRFYNFDQYDLEDIMEIVEEIAHDRDVNDRLFKVYERVMPLVYTKIATY